MTIDLGLTEESLNLYRNIIDNGDSTAINLHFTSQLTNNNTFEIEGVLYQHFDWLNIVLTLGDTFANKNYAGYYEMNFEYEVDGEFVEYSEVFLVKVENSSYNNSKSSFTTDRKYKSFNG